MNDIVIKPAHREDFEIISKLIADQNKMPATHCIQSDTSEDDQGIQRELAGLDLSSALRFVVALQADRLIGALGCELDEELGRGWMRGPFIAADVADWDTLAAALLPELSALLPPAIHWLDSFLNIANTRGNAFYLSQDFHQLRLSHVYVAAAPDRPLDLPGSCSTIKPQQAQAFIDLHQTIFPQTYATGQRILDQLDDNHQVFVYARKDEVLGYLYAALEDSSGDGAIEFVGVMADARGQGIGRQLLQTALQWLFEIKHVPQATLVVNDNLTNARALYERVGFRLKYTGVHARQER
ncbi:MAG: GNAT family N-acetyltransferase [Chloroflexi bacterium]|nr:GNAT family N-acetyltransferase [Chloroflexota bacterium]